VINLLFKSRDARFEHHGSLCVVSRGRESMEILRRGIQPSMMQSCIEEKSN